MDAVMQLPVKLKRVANNGYRASVDYPVELAVEGETAELALANFKEAMETKLAEDEQWVFVPIRARTTGEHPWLRFAGDMRDDPLFDEWQQAIKEYRRERDAEETDW